MFPRAYDYFRPIPTHVLRGSHSHPPAVDPGVGGGGESISDVETGGLIECVICYNVIEPVGGTYMVRT
jgi:hypothetical protein